MDLKHLSWILVLLGLFGLIRCTILIGLFIFFTLGSLCAIYIQRGNLDEFLNDSAAKNPLENKNVKKLGLNFACDKKSDILMSSNAKIRSDRKSKECPQYVDSRRDSQKRSFIDTGIDLLFKKHNKNIEEQQIDVNTTGNKFLDPLSSYEEKKWKTCENIKIHSEKEKPQITVNTHKDKKFETGQIPFDESFNVMGDNPYKYIMTLGNDAHSFNESKTKERIVISGDKNIDQLLHTIINHIIRDFIDSWFYSLSDNKEFGEFRVRNCIEECLINICERVKNTEWISLLTTKLVDDLASHIRIFRLANQEVNAQKTEFQTKINNNMDKSSPQKKNKTQHKRNRSDTDLEYIGGSQKTIANSKFYTETVNNLKDEKFVNDPESVLLNAFFNQSELFKNECMDEKELEKYLTHVVETILYFTLPEEDFACIPLRTFLSTLLANAVFKPFLQLLSDPDFINLHVAKLFVKEPPPVEYFLKALRQSTDLSELRACRQFIIREMSSVIQYTKILQKNSLITTFKKYHGSSDKNLSNTSAINAELSSLKFTQKLIDMRISYLQNFKDQLDTIGTEERNIKTESDQHVKLPLLSLDELLFKELARSYFLDYLSVINLQKYVIFYLMADEWKCIVAQKHIEIQSNKIKGSKDEIFKNLHDKALSIYNEYLTPGSQNYLTVDQGLIEALFLKLNSNLNPDPSWFDSIMKYIYEKLKNEEIFLPKFYTSSGYRKLLLELDVENFSEGSDTNSGDINFDEETTNIRQEFQLPRPDLLNIVGFKHSRSHSDCTGIVPNYSELYTNKKTSDVSTEDSINNYLVTHHTQERAHSAPSRPISSEISSISTVTDMVTTPLIYGTENSTLLSLSQTNDNVPKIFVESKPKLTAKIINTAILSEGQYAVYAIQVSIIEQNQEKSWHIYRRYSKFLELKKLLTKHYPAVAKIPFPAKKAFQNTQRAVLEHRMHLLNEFLRHLCLWAEDNEDMMKMICSFLEPDTDDKKIHSGTVIRTIEHIVNPLKTGMRTIRNMPDTLVGGFSKILLGRGPLKEPSFLEVNSVEQSTEYPALTSAIHLLDEMFDLQARSQWLRRGIINRVLGAPWVSHTANKKIIHAAKAIIEIHKIEHILNTILNSIWPNGKQQKRTNPREDSTKLRTRIAAQMALFALVFDDLKKVVGSETTRSGLLNFFNMWQHKKLNMRLILILMNDILLNVYNIDCMTKHDRN